MEPRCTLCDQLMPEGGYVVATAATTKEPAALEPMCARCVALPAKERKPLRDQAMVRMLRSGD